MSASGRPSPHRLIFPGDPSRGAARDDGDPHGTPRSPGGLGARWLSTSRQPGIARAIVYPQCSLAHRAASCTVSQRTISVPRPWRVRRLRISAWGIRPSMMCACPAPPFSARTAASTFGSMPPSIAPSWTSESAPRRLSRRYRQPSGAKIPGTSVRIRRVIRRRSARIQVTVSHTSRREQGIKMLPRYWRSRSRNAQDPRGGIRPASS